VAGVGGGWREAARQAAFVSQHNEIINCSQATDKRTNGQTDNGQRTSLLSLQRQAN